MAGVHLAVGQDWRVICDGRRFSLTDAPFQRLRPWGFEVFARARGRILAQRRPDFQAQCGVDWKGA
eukprot:1186225-Alexandrium_andersonii.AAC.1